MVSVWVILRAAFLIVVAREEVAFLVIATFFLRAVFFTATFRVVFFRVAVVEERLVMLNIIHKVPVICGEIIPRYKKAAEEKFRGFAQRCSC